MDFLPHPDQLGDDLVPRRAGLDHGYGLLEHQTQADGDRARVDDIDRRAAGQAVAGADRGIVSAASRRNCNGDDLIAAEVNCEKSGEEIPRSGL